MNNANKGFTLIELMIVVAIIAILAAIAIPQYQNYVLRTEMSRAYFELQGLRTAVEICESDGNTTGGCALDSVNSDMLITRPTVTFSPSTITAAFGRRASPRLSGGTVTITRNAAGDWVCEMVVPAGVALSLVPRSCR